MSNVMYRVSSDSRQGEEQRNGFTVVKAIKEQCGCFYYFSKIENACKATQEFGTGIDVMPYCGETRKSDGWYE